jgi:hypothetical protein
MTKINSHTFWHDATQILICWDQYMAPPAGRQYWERAQLVLSRLSPWAPGVHQNADPHILFVNKMRKLWLQDYQLDLNLIFDEYQIVNGGWRGALRVSECDLAYWMLQCGS